MLVLCSACCTYKDEVTGTIDICGDLSPCGQMNEAACDESDACYYHPQRASCLEKGKR